MKIRITKDKDWLNRWDDYVVNTPRANHLSLSDWLKSYSSYGFDYEVGIVTENDKIIGGFGAIIPKVFLFKFYIIPHGPILDKGQENHLDDILKAARLRAKEIGCSYFQFSLPISNNDKIGDHVYKTSEIKFNENVYEKGKLFKHVYCSFGLNWIDLKDFESPEAFLDQLTPKVRRNIRLPYNKGAKAQFVEQEENIRKGYDIIIENSKLGQYSVRSFNDFKNTILNLTSRASAYFINIESGTTLKASCLIVKSGNYLTNISGGVIRERPDIKLGYMLQWEAIKKSFDLGYQGYNISMGGSKGVKEFKERFGAEAIFFEEPHYYFILNPLIFKVYLKFEKLVGPYKSYISVLLSKLRKK